MGNVSVTKPRPWTTAELARLRALYPDTPTRQITIPGRTRGQIHSQIANLHLRKSAAFLAGPDARKRWTPEQIRLLRKIYPDLLTEEVARRVGHPLKSTLSMSNTLGLHKSAAFLASDLSGRLKKFTTAGIANRFKPGHVPFNAGVKGWRSGGRSVLTQFKRGQVSTRWKPEDYQVGTLRMNTDGIIDMKFREGPRAWRAFHVLLWEDAHGPVPAGHCLAFIDRDHFNIELGNLELITRAELMRRNSVQNLPAPLRSAIRLLGQFKRRLREKQDRRSA